MSKSGIKKVIVLGSGALKIGQAGEFDWFTSTEGAERRRNQHRIAQSEHCNHSNIRRGSRQGVFPADHSLLC